LSDINVEKGTFFPLSQRKLLLLVVHGVDRVVRSGDVVTGVVVCVQQVGANTNGDVTPSTTRSIDEDNGAVLHRAAGFPASSQQIIFKTQRTASAMRGPQQVIDFATEGVGAIGGLRRTGGQARDLASGGQGTGNEFSTLVVGLSGTNSDLGGAGGGGAQVVRIGEGSARATTGSHGCASVSGGTTGLGGVGFATTASAASFATGFATHHTASFATHHTTHFATHHTSHHAAGVGIFNIDGQRNAELLSGVSWERPATWDGG